MRVPQDRIGQEDTTPSEVVRVLFPLTRRHGLSTIWITCNPDNWASRRTCQRLGANLVEIVALLAYNDTYKEGEREKCRYRLTL